MRLHTPVRIWEDGSLSKAMLGVMHTAKAFRLNWLSVQADKSLRWLVGRVVDRTSATYMAGKHLNPLSETWQAQGDHNSMMILTDNAPAFATAQQWLASLCMEQTLGSPGSAHLVRMGLPGASCLSQRQPTHCTQIEMVQWEGYCAAQRTTLFQSHPIGPC